MAEVSRKDTINNDVKAALLGGNRFEADVLRNLKAAILNEEVASGRREEGLGDAEIESVVAKEIKRRRESISLYDANGREDLAENERNEMIILERYLPAQVAKDDIVVTIDEAIATTGATGPKDMGKVIGIVKGKLGNSADGATIATLVKEKLQN